jgi:hypothetical protein
LTYLILQYCRGIIPFKVNLDGTSSPRVWPSWSPSLPPYYCTVCRSGCISFDRGDWLGTINRGYRVTSMTTRAPLRIPPHQHAGRIDRHSTTGNDPFPRDAPAPTPQAQESPSCLRSAMSNLILMQQQQSGGTRSTNNAAPLNSPSNISYHFHPASTSRLGSRLDLDDRHRTRHLFRRQRQRQHQRHQQ